MKKSLLIALSTLLGAGTVSAVDPDNRPSPPEPESVVAEMFADYDLDESNSMTEAELAAAFRGIRAKHWAERRDGRPGPRADRANRPCRDNERLGQGPDRRGPRGPLPADRLAALLIERFDADGDAALDTAELLSAITERRERRRHGPRPPFPAADAPASESQTR